MVLVFLDHLWSQPRAGFIGVDVFFVISGYLITGILLNESERRGRISIIRFYQRRARRILPGAITVLIAVVVAARLTFTGARVRETATDVWWALGFGANIHFSDIGTDYFQADRPPSLVQHFWSLAVEEQFYLIWPIVMVIVLAGVGQRRSKKSREATLLSVICAGTLASFSWAVYQTRSVPAAAYFSTPVRAWELGAGAIAAVGLASFPQASTRLKGSRGPLVLFGLVGVIVSAFVVSATRDFPAPGAALPVLSTVVIIVAGAGGPTGAWSSALTNPVSRYLGKISYSLYLWHWPVIVIAAALMPSKPSTFYVVVRAMALGLAMTSYHFIEAPIRALRSRASGEDQAVRRRDGGKWTTKLLTAAACVVLVAVGLAAYAFKSNPAPSPFLADQGTQTSSPTPVSAPSATLPAAGGEVGATPIIAAPSAPLSAAISAAVSATTWPKLSPSIDQLTLASAHDEWLPCDGATVKTLAKCTFGAAAAPQAKTAVVIGDSYALAWMPTIEAALLPAGWKIYGLMLTECPAADVSVDDTATPPSLLSACDTRHKFMLTEAQQLNPGLIILASSAQTLLRLHDKATGTRAAGEYEAAMVKTIQGLGPSATRRIVTLSAPPNVIGVQTCNTKGSSPAKCVSQISAVTKTAAQSEQDAAARTRTSFVNTQLLFCTTGGYCPAFVGTTPVRWDDSHLTDTYAKQLGPELSTSLLGP